jgi:DNA-binding SARP family transcriptional activator/pimeloyl-ACP methyl ester carboxylesterase
VVVAIRVLGALQVAVDGVDVTPAAPKERGLVALLALNRGQVVSADRIIEELWPGSDPDRARHALQVRIAEVRKIFRGSGGETKRLEFVAPGYRLQLFGDEIDEHRFVTLVERARALRGAGEMFAAAETFREALGLWRGDALGDVVPGLFLEAEMARMDEARVDALEDCVEVELACGYHQSLTFELERLVADHPLRERLWAARVLALYRCGRQTEALRVCNTIRLRLADEIGVEPGPALRHLERAVLEQRAELDWSAPRVERRPALGPEDQPPVRYAAAPDGASIAYQVAGTGPVDLIIIPGFTSHLDVWWEPWSGRLARRLMTFCRLIVFDKRGTGLSDRPSHSGIEEWMEDTLAVLDAVGSERAVVLGMSAGGTVAVLFAATYPERTRALILYGAQPCYLQAEDYPWGIPHSAVEPLVDRIRSEWGTGVLFNRFCPSAKDDPALREHYARFQRASASPGAAASYMDSLLRMDVRPALSLVSSPTLVLHATRDMTDPVEAARWTAAQIPNAKIVELDSGDHLIWFTDALDAMVNEIEDFVAGAVPSAAASTLTTVLCVDAPPGLPEHEVVRQIQRHRGRVVDCDEPVLASFDGPARAIRCATAIVADATPTMVRAGLHSGECTIVGHDLRGIAVTIARQLAHHGPPGQVIVTQTIRDLTYGSDIELRAHDCGPIEGVPVGWKTFVVEADVAGAANVGSRAGS